MLFIIIGILAAMLIFKLFGKKKEYGCLLKIFIVIMLWKTGLLAILIRSIYVILRWILTKFIYYGYKLTDYLNEHVFNLIFFS